MCSYCKLKLIPRALVVNLRESNLFLADNLSCGESPPAAAVQRRCSQKKKKTRWHHINMRHIVQPRDPAAEKIYFFFVLFIFFSSSRIKTGGCSTDRQLWQEAFYFMLYIRTESLRVSTGKVTQTFGEGLGLRDTPYGCYGVEWLLRKLPFLFSPAATLG